MQASASVLRAEKTRLQASPTVTDATVELLRPFFSPPGDSPIADIDDDDAQTDVTTVLVTKLAEDGNGVRWSPEQRAVLGRVVELLVRAGAPPARNVSIRAATGNARGCIERPCAPPSRRRSRARAPTRP
jgi:hypothetical protein